MEGLVVKDAVKWDEAIMYRKANLLKFIPVRNRIEKRGFGQVSESGKLPTGKSWLRTFLAIRRWKDSFVVDHIYDGEALWVW